MKDTQRQLAAEIAGRDRLLKRPQAAAYLGLATQTLAKWACTGKYLPLVKLGNRAVRYRQSDLDKFIEKQTVGASS